MNDADLAAIGAHTERLATAVRRVLVYCVGLDTLVEDLANSDNERDVAQADAYAAVTQSLRTIVTQALEEQPWPTH